MEPGARLVCLPEHILIPTFQFLSVRQLCVLEQSCRRFRDVILQWAWKMRHYENALEVEISTPTRAINLMNQEATEDLQASLRQLHPPYEVYPLKKISVEFKSQRRRIWMIITRRAYERPRKFKRMWTRSKDKPNLFPDDAAVFNTFLPSVLRHVHIYTATLEAADVESFAQMCTHLQGVPMAELLLNIGDFIFDRQFPGQPKRKLFRSTDLEDPTNKLLNSAICSLNFNRSFTMAMKGSYGLDRAAATQIAKAWERIAIFGEKSTLILDDEVAAGLCAEQIDLRIRPTVSVRGIVTILKAAMDNWKQGNMCDLHVISELSKKKFAEKILEGLGVPCPYYARKGCFLEMTFDCCEMRMYESNKTLPVPEGCRCYQVCLQ